MNNEEKKMKEEMDGLVARLISHQERLGESDTKFVARYSKVLSYDAWTRRLKPGKYEELKLERWLPKVRKLVRHLNGQATDMDICLSLPITEYTQLLYQVLQGETSDQRVAWLAGDYGTGKTFAMKAIYNQHPESCFIVEADKGMNNSHNNIVRGICAAVGIEGNSPWAMFNKLCETLSSMKAPTLLIDEAQNAGVALWPCLKTLINKTSVRAIVSTHPMALRKLMLSTSEAVAEARQILRRSYMPIRLTWQDGLTTADCEAYLTHVCGLANAAALAEAVAPVVKGGGNFSQLRNAVDNLQASETEITPMTLANAARELSGKNLFRGASQKGVAA